MHKCKFCKKKVFPVKVADYLKRSGYGIFYDCSNCKICINNKISKKIYTSSKKNLNSYLKKDILYYLKSLFLFFYFFRLTKYSSKKKKIILDYGSGSGILSILAKKLGAVQSVGIDIDDKALKNSKTNAILNKTEIELYNSNKQICNKIFDIVAANILYDVLIKISPELKKITRKKLILSGILKNQVAHIVKCFSNWIELRPYEEQEGWYLLCGEL
mgnify:CR=1 FL=1